MCFGASAADARMVRGALLPVFIQVAQLGPDMCDLLIVSVGSQVL